jgi:ABC-2 type transport system ATP-binding protein
VLEMAERMCNRMAIINDGRVLAAGTVKGLKQHQDETLEDVFIRLVGRSIEDLEGEKATQESKEDSEEE